MSWKDYRKANKLLERLSEKEEIFIKAILVDGVEIMVDDEDYAYLTECYNLKMSGKYVYCSPKKKFKGMGLHSKLQLQKLLMNPQKTGRSINVDHKDGNENNYQKENLRVCTHRENSRNRKVQKTYDGKEKTSIYKGVYWFKKYKVWKVDIRIDGGKRIYIGSFTDEVAAANAYNYNAKIYHGEFALLNDCTFMVKDEWSKYRCDKQTSSKYRGVSFVDGKWLTQIYHNGKNIRIGSFDSEIEAAKAYNKMAIELKGNKAKLNVSMGE